MIFLLLIVFLLFSLPFFSYFLPLCICCCCFFFYCLIALFSNCYWSIADLQGFPGDSVLENPSVNAGDMGYAGLIPGSGIFPGGENGNPLQYSCLKNHMDRGAWRATVHGGHKELKWLSHSAHPSRWFTVLY